MQHKTVLLQEAIEGLNLKVGDVFVDGTLGGGGHSEEVAKLFGQSVVMIAIDQDKDAIERAAKRLSSYKPKIHYINDNFRNIDKILAGLNISKVDKILLDIGLSSNQFEESGRGFSFQRDEPLLMTMNPSSKGLTAKEIVNTWDPENIATILKSYGEEDFSWKIAKAIAATREKKEIKTTFDLVEVIKTATPKWYHARKIHPATKTFQALRITVNDEIGSLYDGITKGFDALNAKGRLVVISFHSLEDRTVKRFFQDREKKGLGKIINKKVIIPTKEEILENPRSRSAKLRIIEKL